MSDLDERIARIVEMSTRGCSQQVILAEVLEVIAELKQERDEWKEIHKLSSKSSWDRKLELGKEIARLQDERKGE